MARITSRAVLYALLGLGSSVLAQDVKLEAFRDCPECPEMIALPAGKFRMGSPAAERDRDRDEQPVHEVSVGPFAIGKFEVTFEQWDTCVAGGGCAHKPPDERWGRGAQPVINVSWHDAQGFAQWLSSKTGRTYRLPRLIRARMATAARGRAAGANGASRVAAPGTCGRDRKSTRLNSSH